MKYKRLLIFRVALVLLPLLLILFLESSLRLLNLFPQEPLFLEAQADGNNVFQLNPDVGKRYFDPKQVVVPNLYPETFAREKTPDIYRIFCLGESSTAGFPFDFQVPFPAQLKLLLQSYYPENKIEVINLGMSAISSYTVADFIVEVLGVQPDLIILYMGHNEFYGAYGSASAISFTQNGALIRFYLRLQKLHTVQMIRSLVSSLKPAKQQNPENTTLMEQVIADKKVIYQSEKYHRTLANFQSNLSSIVAQCRQKKIPVLLGTLVANDKDLPPLGSAMKFQNESPGTARIDSLLRSGAIASAHMEALAILQQDSSAACNWFHLGRASLALGDSMAAASCFTAARDRDVVRFRASEDVNRIIRDVAATQGALVAELQAAFQRASPRGIIGKELICDHLHPNPTGYYLMAKVLAEKINQTGWIDKVPASYQPPASPIAVTDLDWDMGLIRIYKLLHRWPFADKKVDYGKYVPYGEPQAARIAYDYVFTHHNWVKAHYAMADYYLERNQPEKARQQYLAVNSYYPQRPEPLFKIAQTFEQLKEWREAETYYLSSLSRSVQRGILYHRLARVQWQQKKMAAAVNTIQMAISAPDLPAQERRTAKLELAGFFLSLDRKEYAIRVLDDILHESPNFQPAREMWQKLNGTVK